jgi:hypothetical protein
MPKRSQSKPHKPAILSPFLPPAFQNTLDWGDKTKNRGQVMALTDAGGKFWRGELRLDGKKFRYGYGTFPEIGVDNARKIHAIARQLVELGKHPTPPRYWITNKLN